MISLLFCFVSDHALSRDDCANHHKAEIISAATYREYTKPKRDCQQRQSLLYVSPEGTDGDFYSFPHISHYCSIYRTCRKKQAMSIKQQAENKYNLCRQFAKLLPTTFEFVNYCPFGALFDMDIPIQSTRPLGVSRQ